MQRQGCGSGDVTCLCVVQRHFTVGHGAQQGKTQLKASWTTWRREGGGKIACTVTGGEREWRERIWEDILGSGGHASREGDLNWITLTLINLQNTASKTIYRNLGQEL